MIPIAKEDCDCGSTSSPEEKKLKKGPWSGAEDVILVEHVRRYGEGNWNSVHRNSGLARCGKSCRLRWANHLRPDLKKGCFTAQEERLILELHAQYGNKWARMATQIPGRTDNEIKNFWNTRMKRRLRQGLPLYPQDIHNSITIINPRPPLTPITPSSSTPHHHISPHLSTNTSTLSFPSYPLPPPQPPPILNQPYYRFGRLRNTPAPNATRIITPPSPSPMMISPQTTPLSSFSSPQFKLDDLMLDNRRVNQVVLGNINNNGGEVGPWFYNPQQMSAGVGAQHWDDSTSYARSSGGKVESMDMMEMKPEDLSELLSSLPQEMPPSVDWFGNVSSNDQSSGVTDDVRQQQYQQASSSFPFSGSSENGSCSWSYMPQNR